jgi:hypothetical protein
MNQYRHAQGRHNREPQSTVIQNPADRRHRPHVQQKQRSHILAKQVFSKLVIVRHDCVPND